ncbi:MAG: ATP-binding cassette domain-containing protein [Deltaproteobacteria bacterium]|nr:MAG: ATP-binding cassette domain-containing protein [Deltaproteobacteria bacterium]
MLGTQLHDRFLEALGPEAAARIGEEELRFAVDFVRLLLRIVPDEVDEGSAQAMRAALTVRTHLDDEQCGMLLKLALAPENFTPITEDELRVFGARFGRAEEEALRHTVAEELDLSGFAEKYGTGEALLLLDSYFAVCAEDGVIDKAEIARLETAANDLGIDPMLVGALFRKHDLRHAAGDFKFELDGNRLLIGRSRAAQILLPDPSVANQHAELVKSGEGWRIVDLGSGRPTLVNGANVTSAPFGAGDTLRVGPYSLTLDPDGQSIVAFGMDSFSALSCRNLKRTIGDVSLLDDVSFTVFSGEVIAMVGPSGAGKTTLLTAIAGIAPADSGDVLMDGQPFHSLLATDRSIVGIVPQDDVVHGELTVEEALFYSGRLRFASDTDKEVIDAEVDRVLEELGIAHVRRSRIGDALKRGISGGQRKRVSLGQELITKSTRVLFLDEPTSGLDPQTAQDIVSQARQLADDGRIVFLVTHDVTPSVMSMVDHLLVLAPGGRLAWFGPPEDACAYFGVDSPDEIFARLPDKQPEQWGKDYREGPARKKYVGTREHLLGLDGVQATGSQEVRQGGGSSWNQYTTLVRRYMKTKLRDVGGMGVLLAQAPLLAVAMVLVFPGANPSALFMLVLSALWFGASTSVRELISERAIWKRERRIGLGVLPYIGSKVTVLSLIVLLQCLMLVTICYVGIGMGGMFDRPPLDGDGVPNPPYEFSFLGLYGVTTLTGLVGMSMGLFLSSAFASSEAAVAALPLTLIPQITFGGLIVYLKDMGIAAQGLTWFMVTRYSFDAAMKTGSRMYEPVPRVDRGQSTGLRTFMRDLGMRYQDLGFPPPPEGTADMGLPIWALMGVLVVFFVGFLSTATVLTARAGRD